MPSVRAVDPSEWRELRKIRLAALEDAPDAFARTHAEEAAFDDDVWLERAAGGNTFLARDEGGRVVGLVTGIHRPEAEQRRELVSMWVAPHARGHGIAGQLVAAVAGWARGDGATELALGVVEGNSAARRAYERAGFVATGERHPVVPGDRRIELQMILEL